MFDVGQIGEICLCGCGGLRVAICLLSCINILLLFVRNYLNRDLKKQR